MRSRLLLLRGIRWRDGRGRDTLTVLTVRYLILSSVVVLTLHAAASWCAAYTVQSGDTLSQIARRELGDASRWSEIAKLNDLKPPYSIKVGQRLALPSEGSSSIAGETVGHDVAVPRPSLAEDHLLRRELKLAVRDHLREIAIVGPLMLILACISYRLSCLLVRVPSSMKRCFLLALLHLGLYGTALGMVMMLNHPLSWLVASVLLVIVAPYVSADMSSSAAGGAALAVLLLSGLLANVLVLVVGVGVGIVIGIGGGVAMASLGQGG